MAQIIDSNIARIGSIIILYTAYKLGLLKELALVLVGAALTGGIVAGLSINGSRLASPIVGGVIGGLIVITLLSLYRANQND